MRRRHCSKQDLTKMRIEKLTSPISTNVEITKKSHLRKMFNPGRIARVSVIAPTLAILSAHRAFADADDRHQQILPFQTITASTIPNSSVSSRSIRAGRFIWTEYREGQ